MSTDQNDKFLARLDLAEEVLNKFKAGKLNNLKKFIFETSCEFRVITDAEKWQSGDSLLSPTDSAVQSSRSTGIIRPAMEDGGLVMIYGQSVTDAEAILFSKTLQSFLTVNYAVLGLDMSNILGNAEIDKTIKKGS